MLKSIGDQERSPSPLSVITDAAFGFRGRLKLSLLFLGEDG
jgi:hypothetical protein